LLEDDTWKDFTTVQVRILKGWNNEDTIELDDLGNGLYRVEKSELTGKFYFYGSRRNGYPRTDQTDNLTVPTNGDNLYTITEYGRQGNAEGDWSKKN
jgi:hypothetical protein